MIQGLEHDWRKMQDAKFLNVVKEFEQADKKRRDDGKKKKSSLQKKRKESEEEIATMGIMLRVARGGDPTRRLVTTAVRIAMIILLPLQGCRSS